MNDTSLLALREEPSPEFAARLHAKLREDDRRPETVSRRERPLLHMAASLVAVVATAALFAVPAVRAGASALLARFRVVRFVAVPVDASRVAELRATEIGLQDLIGEHVTVVQDPGAPVAAASPEEAATASGIPVHVPAWIPPDVSLAETTYRGPGRVQVVADTARLGQLLELLGIDDVEVPAALGGGTATIDVPAMVKMRYANDRGAAVDFLQARSPEVQLPEGVEVEALAEIGLRILGFGAGDAKRFARTIDWRTTMLVPIPSGAAQFRHVEINGHPGLAIEGPARAPEAGAPPGTAPRPDQIVIWSADGMLFGIRGNFRRETVLQMAYSTR